MTASLPASDTAGRVDPQTPCAHCGLPVGAGAVGHAPAFCCTGCAVVYDALRQAGFSDTFYRLRAVDADAEACPVPQAAPHLLLAELDSDAFLARHTRLLGDATREADLFLDGVHCAACVWLVERMPYELAGVHAARLNLPRARLTVRWDPEAVSLSEVARWLARFGYNAHPARQAGTGRTEAERALLVRMGVAWALAGNVMLLAFALYAGLDAATDAVLAAGARWLSLLLALPAVLYSAAPFFRRAWAALAVRRLHMDTPIALGILVGFGHSAWATVTGWGEVWFDSITVLIAALLTARWLQLRSRRQAGDATERLLTLLPTMARRMKPDGTVAVVTAEALQPGDLVEVAAGEVLPVDGVVEAGASMVNKAVLTGESRPEAVAVGAPVVAGATNLEAPLQVRVQAVGDATRVGRLLAWVREAEAGKAPVVLLADRLSGYFVGTVLALALLTALIWLYLDPSAAALHVVALLVITCPCALGMATPLAMAVATGRAARAGIFIKHDAALQQLTEVDAVVLDKTGTLTEGAMALVDYEGDPAALGLAAALEAQSRHPIALALRRAAGDPAGAPLVREVRHIVGQGLRGIVAGCPVAVGRPDWVTAQATGPSPACASALARYSEQGYTPVAVAVDGTIAAVMAFGDAVRPDARGVVRQFIEEGKAVYVLSGDHPAVVHSVARTLGIDPAHAHGHVEPEAKHAFVEQLRRQHGLRVAMVGDGVNDAAALQAADVGIAVHGGSTASLVAADVFMTRAGVGPLLDLFAGARQVIRVIRRNLGWALGYNLVGAAAAMAGLVNPLVAAIAMPLSSLFVVTLSVAQQSFAPGSERASGAAARASEPDAPGARPAAVSLSTSPVPAS